MSKNLPILFYFFSVSFHFFSLFASDLTLVGYFNHADGLGRIPIGIIDVLNDEVKINCVLIGEHSFQDVKQEIIEIISNSNSDPQIDPGKVSIMTYCPIFRGNAFLKVPNSLIKIAYSMCEATLIPQDWVDAFNHHFDAVVVPDPFLVKVYQDSGVKIPIFVLPLGMYLKDFSKNKHSKLAHRPFVFGTACSYVDRKNIPTLIQAFKEEFGDDKDVKLYIHGRNGEREHLIDPKNLGAGNIFLRLNPVDHRKYLKMMKSFDCYVNISKGEGFSCGPREALAMAIPCIISDHTAHHTICESGFVEAVPATIIEDAVFNAVKGMGHRFNCKIEDVRAGMRKVYEEYAKYHERALLGSKWVLKYSWGNLRKKYLNLVKPKRVILGDKNEVTNKYLMTQSQELYHKYLSICERPFIEGKEL